GAARSVAYAEPAQDGPGAFAADATAGETDRVIIRRGNLELEAADVTGALAAARAAIEALGGYVASAQTWGAEADASAAVVYRVPADRLDAAIERLSDLATTVRSATLGAEEVTDQVVDTEARLTNLRAAEAALQSLMAKSASVTDILAVELRLTEVRGEIEVLDARRADLLGQAAHATLTVGWYPPVPPAVAMTATGWDPLAVADAAVARLVGLLQGLATVTIYAAIVGVPLLAALAAAALLARRALPRLRRDGRSHPVA
ncbi:MAG: DUF4349 domain-containing protein, partial [Chloroflexota bacterium]